jgi:hypothetical protein
MDLNKLINDMIGAVSGIAKKDITLIEGFSKSQMQKIAEQTVWFAEADGMGMFDNNKPLRDHFLKGIEEVTRLCAKTLVAIAAITVEKIWNALVGVVWGALDAAVGIALPRPLI